MAALKESSEKKAIATDLTVERLEIGAVEVPRAAIVLERQRRIVRSPRMQLRQVHVQYRVGDPELERVLDHLHLQALATRGGRVERGISVGERAGRGEQRDERHKPVPEEHGVDPSWRLR